jgi:hypothetical protein
VFTIIIIIMFLFQWYFNLMLCTFDAKKLNLKD